LPIGSIPRKGFHSDAVGVILFATGVSQPPGQALFASKRCLSHPGAGASGAKRLCMDQTVTPPTDTRSLARPTRAEQFAVFGRIGLLSFGGLRARSR
jgi:hypothetical protein